MKPVRWHPIALEEAERAAEYYRSQRESLDFRFFAAVSAAVSLIERFPGLGAPIHNRYRRVILHRFPYSLIYREQARYSRIVAVVHHRLDPQGWMNR